jgi:hypothetical protein
MTTRPLFVGLAAAGFVLITGSPAPSQATSGPVLEPPAQAELVQEAGYYKRRWRYRNGTYVRAPFAELDDTGADSYVRAPFARVYSGRRGTWVRAPFVDLWVPR